MANLNVRIKNKFDTYENWMNSSLVLEAGEIAIASIPSGDSTGLTPPAIGVKVGDGSKTFSQLSWIQATAGDVYSWAKAATKPEYKADEITGLSEYISGEIEDTDTQYQLVKVDDYNYKLQAKSLNGDWADVTDGAIVIPKYDDTALAGRVTANEGAIAAIKDGTSIDSFADVEAALADKQATGDYALNSAVTDVADRVTAIEGDYLKAADKYDDTALAGRVKAIEDDYLTSADKYDDTALADRVTAVEGSITTIKDGTSIDSFKDVEDALAGKQATGDYALNSTVSDVADRVTAIEGDYLKTADKYDDTALAGRIKAVEDDYLTSADKEALQTQINTIMNNPDTEGVINSINEFTAYIEEHGEIAEGFRTDIDANAEAIETLEADVAANYQTKEEAEAAYDELAAEVAAKAVQADWSQNDSTAADYVKNRTHYDNSSIEYLVKDFDLSSEWDYVGQGMYRLDLPEDATLNIEGDATYYLDFNGTVYSGTGNIDDYDGTGRVSFDVEYEGTTVRINFSNNPNTMSNYGNFSSMPGVTISLYTGIVDIKQLDEKFIPDTIARTADVEAAVAAVHTHENKDVLDDITADRVDAWDLAEANVLENIAGVEGSIENKTFTITGISADLLTQGSETLVFDCGTSAV